MILSGVRLCNRMRSVMIQFFFGNKRPVIGDWANLDTKKPLSVEKDSLFYMIIDHSDLKLFTGLARAALTALYPTVTQAIAIEAIIANMNISGLIGMR